MSIDRVDASVMRQASPLKLKFGALPPPQGVPSTPTPGSSDVTEKHSQVLKLKIKKCSSASTMASQTPSQTKESPLRSLYGEFVQVKVGLTKIAFGVHKGLLCQRSKFFNKAFSKPSTEAKRGEIDLPNESSTIFEIVNVWLYTNTLTYASNGKDVALSSHKAGDVYNFGVYFGMPMLCNKAVDAVIQFSGEGGCSSILLIAYVYKKTDADCPLRKAVVATYTQHIRDPDIVLETWGQSLLKCPEFLLDLSKALASSRGRPNSPNPIFYRCQFHQHEEGEEICS